jgi:hypothetical protein
MSDPEGTWIGRYRRDCGARQTPRIKLLERTVPGFLSIMVGGTTEGNPDVAIWVPKE